MAQRYLCSTYLLGIIAALTVANFVEISQADVVKPEPVCTSKSCRTAAARLLRNMKSNEDPCNSFYEYACGNWPDDEKYEMKIVTDDTRHKVKELIEGTVSADNTALNKLRRFYQSCLKTANSSDEDILLEVLSIIDSNGGWPFLMTENEWASNNRSWQEVDIAFRKSTGFSPFFQIQIAVIPFGDAPTFIHIIPTDATERSLFDDDLDSFEDVKRSSRFINYKNAVKNITQTFGNVHNKSVADEKLDNDLEAVTEFEWELYLIKEKFVKEGTGTPKRLESMSIGEFRSNFSSRTSNTDNKTIDFVNILEQYIAEVHNFHLSGSEVVVFPLDYLSDLADLIDETPSKVIVETLYLNFMEYIQRERPFISEEFSQNTDMKKQICETITQSNFPTLVDQSYVQKYGSNAVINKALQMLPIIKNGMTTVIEQTSLSGSLKQYWLNVTENSEILVGYPAWYINKTKVNDEYKDLIISESYFNNIVAIKHSRMMRDLKKLKDGDDFENLWPVSPLISHTWFDEVQSKLFINDGILHRPWFSLKQPDVANYGALGIVIEHQLAHNLHGRGNPFQEDGTLQPWHAQMDPQLENHYRCVIEKYSNYSIFGGNTTHQVNSIATVMDNVADIVGIQAGYKAFQFHKQNHPEANIRLPGLKHLNNDQLLFLFYASTKCRPKNIDGLDDEMVQEEILHSRLRVDAALSSSDVFGKVFQCARGSRMNPVKKCNLGV